MRLAWRNRGKHHDRSIFDDATKTISFVHWILFGEKAGNPTRTSLYLPIGDWLKSMFARRVQREILAEISAQGQKETPHYNVAPFAVAPADAQAPVAGHALKMLAVICLPHLRGEGTA